MPEIHSFNWAALDRLRAIFLGRDAAANGPYWNNHDTLAAYDATYAERIGWKWDALLRELRERAWTPPAGSTLLDFGCGSGIAGRRVLSAFGASHFAGLALADHSPEAVAYAAERARESFPDLKVQVTPVPAEPYTLVVSHVLNELNDDARAELLTLAAQAACVLWIEPGTHVDSRALATVRDSLRTAGHRIVAPCTHRENCPLFLETNARDWCHFFAEPPAGVQNNPDWVRFAQRAGVDLRSQAYSCLVLDRVTEPAVPEGSARLLGRPEVFKPYARFLACESDGLHWLELSKRVNPVLVKRLDRNPPVPLYQLNHDGRHVTYAHPFIEPAVIETPA